MKHSPLVFVKYKNKMWVLQQKYWTVRREWANEGINNPDRSQLRHEFTHQRKSLKLPLPYAVHSVALVKVRTFFFPESSIRKVW